MLSNLFCVRLYYACYLCCLGLALSAIIFILFRDSVCFNTHWDHGPLLMKEKKKSKQKTKRKQKTFAFLNVLANAVNKAVFYVCPRVGVVCSKRDEAGQIQKGPRVLAPCCCPCPARYCP